VGGEKWKWRQRSLLMNLLRSLLKQIELKK